MELAKEKNNDLAFDTDAFRTAALKYSEIAEKLDTNCKELDALIQSLKDNGWTTEAGKAFYELMKTNWADNIKKYVDLLNTLSLTLTDVATEYEALATEHIRKTKVNIEQS